MPVANILQPLIDVAHAILVFFHDQVGVSWGLSIIALTFVVRVAILPLTFKQVRGMQELQRHAPELKKLQERYKDDPKRKQEEMMRFYQEHNFNPMGACLPLLLQFPVFISLFYLLRSAEFRNDIRGEESFGFIPNLAAPLTDHIPVLLFMMALYLLSQLGASLVSAVSADRNQRLLILGLPFVFVFFIINFEAGLMVYWITTNVWTIGQQLLVKKLLPPPAKPGEDADGDEKRASEADGEAAKSARGKRAAAKAAGNGRATTPPRPEASAQQGGRNVSGNGAGARGPAPSARKKRRRSGRRR